MKIKSESKMDSNTAPNRQALIRKELKQGSGILEVQKEHLIFYECYATNTYNFLLGCIYIPKDQAIIVKE